MPSHWFAAIDGDILGPLSPAQLHVFVERGWVGADTPVKHDRMRRFVPAGEVVGLLPGERPAPRMRGRKRTRRAAGFRRAALLALVVLGVLALGAGVLAVLHLGGPSLR